MYSRKVINFILICLLNPCTRKEVSTALASFSQLKSHVLTERQLKQTKGHYPGHSVRVNMAEEMEEQRVFGQKTSYEKYSLLERRELALKVKECKEEYIAELESMRGKTHWDPKRKRHVQDTPKQGYLTKAVRSFYVNLKDALSDSQEMKNACKVAKRCYEKLENGDFEDGVSRKKFRSLGGGRKARAVEVREELFQWFIDVRTSLNARLPKSLFLLQAKKLYEDWLQQHPDTPEEEKLQFSNQWIKGWEEEYGVSLRKPNKRYSISRDDCIVRTEDYLKNIWSLRHYFIKTFGIDPPIINGDQMPLHRNESSGQATLNFKNNETFVKENHHLSRERVTVFTQIASDANVKLPPEFVFKGTGKRPPQLAPPPGIKYQWAPKGSYRLEQLVETINHLPNRFNMFSHQNFAIYVLDDYAVHLMPEVRQALWKRGYILVVIGGGITGFVQVNDTHLHRALKLEYRKKESALMLEKLKDNPQKVPAPDRIEMMTLLNDAMQDVRINESSAFKSVWVTNALDGSEDYLVSDKIFSLVGESMRSFRAEMLKKSPPSTIKEVIRSIIPPKGIKRGKNTEGTEIFDGEEMGEEDADDEEEANTDQLLEALQSNDNIAIETWNEEPPRESNAVSGNAISLVGISEDEDINKDAQFLDEISKVFQKYKTSVKFSSSRNMLENSYQNARRSLKKRIQNS